MYHVPNPTWGVKAQLFRTDAYLSGTTLLNNRCRSALLSPESKAERTFRNTVIVSFCKVRRSSKNCRWMGFWSTHARPVRNPPCYSRVCSAHALYNLEKMMDPGTFDIVGITLMSPWLARSLHESFSKMGITSYSRILAIPYLGEMIWNALNRPIPTCLNRAGTLKRQAN